MFKDEVIIQVKSGCGGSGCISFRREKYIEFGGPNGGDGGDGGNIIFKVNKHLCNLNHLHQNSIHPAQKGKAGEGNQRQGRNGQDCIIEVPQGTIVKNAHTKEKIIDLVNPNQEYIVSKGGKGGQGNMRFKTSINQTPRYAQPGEETSMIRLSLQLNLIADVGVIGFPNSGKSTLLRGISNARPKIGNYAFTTLYPNLGVVSLKDYRTYIVSDIPGIIEGAHQGSGLGIRFLKHLNRTKILLMVLDLTQDNPFDEWLLLQNELNSFSSKQKPYFILLNKIDLLSDEEQIIRKQQFLDYWKNLNHPSKDYFIKLFCISAKENIGLEELKESIYPFVEQDQLNKII